VERAPAIPRRARSGHVPTLRSTPFLADPRAGARARARPGRGRGPRGGTRDPRPPGCERSRSVLRRLAARPPHPHLGGRVRGGPRRGTIPRRPGEDVHRRLRLLFVGLAENHPEGTCSYAHVEARRESRTTALARRVLDLLSYPLFTLAGLVLNRAGARVRGDRAAPMAWTASLIVPVVVAPMDGPGPLDPVAHRTRAARSPSARSSRLAYPFGGPECCLGTLLGPPLPMMSCADRHEAGSCSGWGCSASRSGTPPTPGRALDDAYHKRPVDFLWSAGSVAIDLGRRGSRTPRPGRPRRLYGWRAIVPLPPRRPASSAVGTPVLAFFGHAGKLPPSERVLTARHSS
jgi:hypothetical protein